MFELCSNSSEPSSRNGTLKFLTNVHFLWLSSVELCILFRNLLGNQYIFFLVSSLAGVEMNFVILVGLIIGMDNRHVNVHFGMRIIPKTWQLIQQRNMNNRVGIRFLWQWMHIQMQKDHSWPSYKVFLQVVSVWQTTKQTNHLPLYTLQIIMQMPWRILDNFHGLRDLFQS